MIAITLSGRAFDPDAKASWFESVLAGKDAGDDWPSAMTRAYGTVRQWGGDIAVSAAPGAGTVLRLFLESVREAAKGRSAPTLEPAGVEPGLETILVVDDEAASVNWCSKFCADTATRCWKRPTAKKHWPYSANTRGRSTW